MEEMERVFREEYEREKARHAFRSDREKSAAQGQRKLSYFKMAVMGASVVYSILILKEWGFDIDLFLWKDKTFVSSLIIILLTPVLGHIIFRK